MRVIRAFLFRLSGLFNKERKDRDFAEELGSHLQMHIEDNTRSGMTPENARREALLSAGGLESAKEAYRDRRGLPLLETVLQDLHYGIRTMRNSPGFTVTAVLTLAAGIGANTAIFSVVNSVLLRALPYKDSDRIAILWSDDRKHNLHEQLTSLPNFEDWKAQSRTFAEMAIAYWPGGLILREGQDPEEIEMSWTTADLFRLLGVAPLLGRTFSAEEVERGERVVVLSHGLWKRRFGGDINIVGKRIMLSNLLGEGRTSRVIGVMPAQFQLPDRNTQLWEPATLWPAWSRNRASRAALRWRVLGRLKDGVSFEQAQAEMATIASRLAKAYPQSNSDYDVRVVPLGLQIVGHVRFALVVLSCAVVFVLLIACVNLASLLLARAASREREMALRMALGADRWRLAQQMLTESTVLSMVAAAPGLILAVAGVRALVAFAPAGIPRLDEIRVDSAALVFTFCISLVAGLLFGMAPAFEISRNDPIESIKKSSQGSGGRVARIRGLLMIAEVAAAVILLAGAGLLVRSFILIRAVDPGFRPEHVLFVEIPHSWSRNTPEKRVAFCREVVDRVQSLPGVRAAGVTADFFILPEPEGRRQHSVSIEGREPMIFDQLTGNAVSPGYFRAMGVPLLRGRFFSDEDGPNAVPLAIVNQTLGRSLWPGEDPVGKRFSLNSGPTAIWYTVIGVVGDMRRERPELPPTPQYFQPQTQRSIFAPFLAARLDSGAVPRGLAADILAIIRSIDKTQPRPKVVELQESLAEIQSTRRFQTSLLSLLSLIALGLAAVGIYGLMHYSVAQRTREIGIRMAFGARRGDVLRMVIRQALGLAMTGIAVGMAGGYAVARTISTLLYGVKPTDPATFAGVGLVILAATLTASSIPAWRATKVDPMVALHYE